MRMALIFRVVPKDSHILLNDNLCFILVKNFSIILARALNIYIINDDYYIKISYNIEIAQFDNEIDN